MIGNRRKARESALQVLYQDEFHTDASRGTAERYFWEDSDFAQQKKEVRSFASFLVEGVRVHRHEIDDIIRAVAKNWKIERMSRVDRNILRLATFELLFARDIPPKVSLNEAIEIAKIYGAEDSGAFINGILDKISRQLGGDQADDAAEAAGPAVPAADVSEEAGGEEPPA